jgi:hypothetical protein
MSVTLGQLGLLILIVAVFAALGYQIRQSTKSVEHTNKLFSLRLAEFIARTEVMSLEQTWWLHEGDATRKKGFAIATMNAYNKKFNLGLDPELIDKLIEAAVFSLPEEANREEAKEYPDGDSRLPDRAVGVG